MSKVKKSSVMVLDLDLAKRVLSVVDKGLSGGLGEPKPGQMCVEAAVCFALGLPHDDNPPCVGEQVRNAKIQLNDTSYWGTDKERARGLRDLAVAQLGSDKIDQKKFAKVLAVLVMQRVVSKALRSVKKEDESEWLDGIVKLTESVTVESPTKTLKKLGLSGFYDNDGLMSSDLVGALDSLVSSTGIYGHDGLMRGRKYDVMTYAQIAVDVCLHVADHYDSKRAALDILHLTASCILDALRECGSPGIALLDELKAA